MGKTDDARSRDIGFSFPVKRIATALSWDDLVLHPNTLRRVKELEYSIQHSETKLTDWTREQTVPNGNHCLFYGPMGTGKTSTACLLGKSIGRAVYRVDLSRVVSKYIGATEKNLAKVFEQARTQNWILFFDEVDAVFGKRSGIRDPHNHFANLQISYLLQRVEHFDGIIFFSSNLKKNIDEAFLRRLKFVVHFPLPGVEQRRQLWKKVLPPRARMEKTINIDMLARDHRLSGGAIMNVVRYASLESLERGNNVISLDDLMQGINRERTKKGG